MSIQNQSQIIELSLIKWVSLLTHKTVTSFSQLSTGEFYISLLSSVKQFKFIKPLRNIALEQQANFHLAGRISNIKIIGDSVLRYYQTRLMKDVSEMKVNYVQLCMGSVSESIKLFSLIVGVFACDEGGEVYLRLIESIGQLQQDDQYIVKALLQNSKSIGQSIVRKEDSPLQRKMLSRLQVYEQKIQNLQAEVQQLRLQLQEERQCNESCENEIKQLKSQKSKLLQKSQVLQLLNTRLQSQNTSFILQNQNLVKRLQSQKRHYDQLLEKHQQAISSYEKQISSIQCMKQKIDELKGINAELKQQLSERVDEKTRDEDKFQMMRDNYKHLQQSHINLQNKLSQTELEYQEFKYKQQHYSNIKSKLNTPLYHMSNNSELSSINYRVRDRLDSAFKGELSQVQMVNSKLVRQKSAQSGQLTKMNARQMQGLENSMQRLENSMQRLENSTLANRHQMMRSHLENFSHFVVNQFNNPHLRDIEDVTEFDGEFLEDTQYGEEELDKSIIVGQEDQHENQQQQCVLNQQIHSTQLNPTNKQFRTVEQRDILVSTISTLLDQNQQLKQQLNKYHQTKKHKEHRLEIFRQKLSKIRQIQPIQEIHNKFQTFKENISQNSFPILMTEKQQQRRKNQQSSINEMSSSKRCPYYPLILN